MLARNDMNPVSWTWKRGFYMSKLSYEDKINIYNNKKEGMTIKVLSKKYVLIIINTYFFVFEGYISTYSLFETLI